MRCHYTQLFIERVGGVRRCASAARAAAELGRRTARRLSIGRLAGGRRDAPIPPRPSPREFPASTDASRRPFHAPAPAATASETITCCSALFCPSRATGIKAGPRMPRRTLSSRRPRRAVAAPFALSLCARLCLASPPRRPVFAMATGQRRASANISADALSLSPTRRLVAGPPSSAAAIDWLRFLVSRRSMPPAMDRIASGRRRRFKGARAREALCFHRRASLGPASLRRSAVYSSRALRAPDSRVHSLSVRGRVPLPRPVARRQRRTPHGGRLSQLFSDRCPRS